MSQKKKPAVSNFSQFIGTAAVAPPPPSAQEPRAPDPSGGDEAGAGADVVALPGRAASPTARGEVVLHEPPQFPGPAPSRTPAGRDLPGVTLRMDRGRWERLKTMSIQQRRPIQAILEEALRDYMVKNGHPW